MGVVVVVWVNREQTRWGSTNCTGNKKKARHNNNVRPKQGKVKVSHELQR